MRMLTLLFALLAAPAVAQTAPSAPPPASPHIRAAKPKPKPRPTPVVAAPHAAPRIAHAPPAAPVPAPVLATPAPAAPPPEPGRGTVTGQPIPRWAAFRSDEVNLRAGPGTRYPIDWVYHRRDLPVQIEREFEVWRLVEDQDGVKGWVHQATLVGRRGFVVKDGLPPTLRAAAAEDAAPVAILKPGVVGRVRACAERAAWCEMQVGDYRGFLRRESVYGLSPDEAVNP